MKALKMSVIHVVAFIVSWTPYTIMGTWCVQYRSHRLTKLILKSTLFVKVTVSKMLFSDLYTPRGPHNKF